MRSNCYNCGNCQFNGNAVIYYCSGRIDLLIHACYLHYAIRAIKLYMDSSRGIWHRLYYNKWRVPARQQCVTLYWLTAGNKTVSVEYSSSAGCTVASSASNTTLVNITPVAVSCFANPDPVCVGSATNFNSNYACNTSVLNFNGDDGNAYITTPVSTDINNVL